MRKQTKSNLYRFLAIINKYEDALDLKEDLEELELVFQQEPRRLMTIMYKLMYISLIRADTIEENIKELFGVQIAYKKKI